MKYIKPHFRAGYTRHNKDGSTTYVPGTTVKGHFQQDSSFSLSSNSIKRTHRSEKRTEGATYYSYYDKLDNDYTFNNNKTERLRIKDNFGGSVSYTYDSLRNVTIIERNDGQSVSSHTEVIGNQLPYYKKIHSIGSIGTYSHHYSSQSHSYSRNSSSNVTSVNVSDIPVNNVSETIRDSATLHALLDSGKEMNINEYEALLEEGSLNTEKTGYIFNVLGVKYSEKHDYAKAEKYYEQAIDCSSNAYAIGNLFSDYIKLEKYEEILKRVNDPKYLDVTQGDNTFHAIYRIALIYRDGNTKIKCDVNKYISLIKQCCDSSISCGYWYVEYVNRLISNNEFDDAARYCDIGLSKPPCDIDIYGRLLNLLGVIYGNHNSKIYNPAKAKEFYLKAIRNGNSSARGNLNILENNLKNNEEGIQFAITVIVASAFFAYIFIRLFLWIVSL